MLGLAWEASLFLYRRRNRGEKTSLNLRRRDQENNKELPADKPSTAHIYPLFTISFTTTNKAEAKAENRALNTGASGGFRAGTTLKCWDGVGPIQNPGRALPVPAVVTRIIGCGLRICSVAVDDSCVRVRVCVRGCVCGERVRAKHTEENLEHITVMKCVCVSVCACACIILSVCVALCVQCSRKRTTPASLYVCVCACVWSVCAYSTHEIGP